MNGDTVLGRWGGRSNSGGGAMIFGGRYFWHSVRPHGIGGIVLQGPRGDVVRDSRVGSEKAE